MRDDQAERVTLAQAAVRLGVTQDTVRRRIKRRELTATRDNRGRYLVLLPPRETPGAPPDPPSTYDSTELVAELRARVASLERRLDEAQAERRQLLALVEWLTTEQRREQRTWPGLRTWWWRLWSGEAHTQVPERRRETEQESA